MKTTNDDCVGIRGNNTRFSRGETHESKQRRLYIYQRAAPSLSLCSTKPLLRPAWRQIVVQQTIQTAANMYTECTVLFSLAQRYFAKPKRCRYLLPVTATVSQFYLMRLCNSCSICACFINCVLFYFGVICRHSFQICVSVCHVS